MVATKLAPLERGPPSANAQISAITQSGAAEMLNVSRDSVKCARKVIDGATPDLITAVEQGEVAPSSARRLT